MQEYSIIVIIYSNRGNYFEAAFDLVKEILWKHFQLELEKIGKLKNVLEIISSFFVDLSAICSVIFALPVRA